MTQEMGAKVVSTPRKGDLLFFFSTTEKVKPYIHIAIIAEANENSIRVIHGNYNNKVAVLNNTGFNDGKGNSTSGGTLKCVYVRPAYRKTKTDTSTCIQLKPGMNVQFVARCCTSCAIGSTASKTCGRVKLISKDNKAATTWKVCMNGNYFYFVNEKGYVLDAYGIRTAKCADMQIFKKRSKLRDTSLFTVKYERDHCYLMFKDTPYCADCYGYNNWHEGTRMHCWNYKSDISQQFKVIKV